MLCLKCIVGHQCHIGRTFISSQIICNAKTICAQKSMTFYFEVHELQNVESSQHVVCRSPLPTYLPSKITQAQDIELLMLCLHVSYFTCTNTHGYTFEASSFFFAIQKNQLLKTDNNIEDR